MMIGPMKKKMITVGVVSFILPTILLVAIFGMYSTNKKAEIENLKSETAVVMKYVFSGDMPVDHIVRSKDLKLVGVKEMSAPIDSFDEYALDMLVGRKLKIPVFDRTIVTENMFYQDDDSVTTDLRKKEFNMINLPSDLVEGDFIDIRILFPTGEDFLVVVGKEVKQMGTNADSNSIFLELTEEEMIKLSGAIIESYISNSVNLYAVKYVNNYQQLFKEEHVDYVAKYQAGLAELISGDYEIAKLEADKLMQAAKVEENESGEFVEIPRIEVTKKTATDYTAEQIAARAGISVEIAKIIKEAFEDADEEMIRKYSNKTIVVSQLLTPNYPIRNEVYSLIKNNPNILDTLKAKYNIETLVAQRANMINTSIYKEDDYTGEWKEDTTALGSISTRLDKEIELQKTERKEYLQNLIRNNLVSGNY